MVTLEKTEDNSLTTGHTTTLAAHWVRAEVRLINSCFAIIEWRLALAFFRDALTNFAKDSDDCALGKFSQLSHSAGSQIEREVTNEEAEFPFCDSRTPVIAI